MKKAHLFPIVVVAAVSHSSKNNFEEAKQGKRALEASSDLTDSQLDLAASIPINSGAYKRLRESQN